MNLAKVPRMYLRKEKELVFYSKSLSNTLASVSVPARSVNHSEC